MHTRTPSPPYGYSRVCEHSLEQQIHIVAEFYVHNIRPSRIAYRIGIDIDLIERLITGEAHPEFFSELVKQYRRHRRRQRLQDSLKVKGSARVDLQREVEREFSQNAWP